MTDTLSKKQRSAAMSKVRGANTKPEWILRCGLHRLGFRYRLGNRHLPGRPDLAFPMYRAVVFVHGCYWHRHRGCKDASTPKSNVAFWTRKFAENVERDRRTERQLTRRSWRVLVVWECELLNHTVETVQRVALWLRHETAAADQSRYDEPVVDRRELLSVAEKKVRYRIASYDEKPDLRDSGAREVQQPYKSTQFAVVDLFSGAGGMSYGFRRHPAFRIVGAADAELGKPSTGRGKLQCNSTYVQNIGVSPARLDLSAVSPGQLRSALALPEEQHISVLSACPPCTGFSRANPENHLRDDWRNSLVRRSAEFAVALSVDIVVMENARELIRGNFKHHYEWFREHLESHGYNVFGRTYMLSRFGLPQIRERAIVVAVKQHLPLHTLDSLWDGWGVRDEALTVRRTFDAISRDAVGSRVFPNFSSGVVRQRIAAIPKDGGSWVDLLRREDAEHLLTDAMKRTVASKRFGSYPDVYGRMAWDKPAPTIKRECAHVGNGRYVHPEEDRLCSVRELAALQGFPNDFVFNGAAVSNMYRHIGDAVPPLISYQLAHLVYWILTGEQPRIEEILLPETNLRRTDVVRKRRRELFHG
jgi:DNA (cytosine-5)-methyltransferase 1